MGRTLSPTTSRSILFRFPIWSRERRGKLARLGKRRSTVDWRRLDYLDALGGARDAVVSAAPDPTMAASRFPILWQLPSSVGYET
jgi:hypothetical protein